MLSTAHACVHNCTDVNLQELCFRNSILFSQLDTLVNSDIQQTPSVFGSSAWCSLSCKHGQLSDCL